LLPTGPYATLSRMDRLRLAYLALSVGMMAFGAIWGWLGARGPAQGLPRGPRLLALLGLLVAAGGTVLAVILEGRAARPW
jgi:hypothetical protein